MAEDHIISWSRPYDLVFDPMCGAATTCKMALFNNRHYFGMEVHAPYFRIAQARLLLAHEKQKKRLDDQFYQDTDTAYSHN